MRNIPLTREQNKKLKKGFYVNQFANRRTRRAKPDKFTQLKKAVEKRKEAEEALAVSFEIGNTIEFRTYWKFRNRVNRLAQMCYPKRTTV
jgi:hypothetical protein